MLISLCVQVQGNYGAQALAKILTERGVSLEFVLDEGLTIVKDVLKGIDVPIGL